MKRVVITGLGIISCIGNNKEEVVDSLKAGKSGVELVPDFIEHGMRSHIAGTIKGIDPEKLIDRKAYRFMSPASAYAYLAMEEAIEDSKLTEDLISNPRTGIVMGVGGASPIAQTAAYDASKSARGIKAIGPYAVPKTMCSGPSATLATPFKIKGVNYTISSACSTSAHCIGNAVELIQIGKQDIIFAGGCEELSWQLASLFDAMGALSFKYNDNPTQASRPYDADRDGFVIGSGSAVLVIESLESALARGAKIYAEVVGYGANSDGYDMVAPSGEGALRCMKLATDHLGDEIPDYVNTHGTSTPVGDTKELESIALMYPTKSPAIGSTKSLTGHSLGATGAQEAIYTLLMMTHDFIAPSINIFNRDPNISPHLDLVTETRYQPINYAISNSFGFGGTNATLAFKKYKG